MKTILEDSMGLQEATPEAEPERLPGGIGRPHLDATRPMAVAPTYQLLECSSTASLDYIYAILQVSLIQGLMLDPLGYIRRPQPPLRHQVIKS
jgi:hypothetical protein